MGRSERSRNRGFFFREGRGWYGNIEGKYVALEHPNGDRMRDKSTPITDVKKAYQRLIATPQQEEDAHAGITMNEICTAYLSEVKSSGAPATFTNRQNTLFDFCMGLPSRFIPKGKPVPKPHDCDFIHKGFGRIPADKLLPIHVDRWLQAHPTWKGGRRTRIQALKRALNYAVEAGLLKENPIKGYKTPKQNARVTYLTPEQETALCNAANDMLAIAIKVCIRTGARPGCEFAKLTAAHVTEYGDRMEWRFKATESKTKILRIIRIIDSEIIKIVRAQIAKYPSGAIFRNNADTPWTRENLSEKFRDVKNRLIKRGMTFDDDACMYSCRHTYAKRVLQGYWSGKTTNIETLAKLMGNSPQVCRDHYLQWCDHYSEPLWESA